MAATVEYQGWTESDDPTPGHVGHDLVFFKAASVNYGHTSGTALEHLVPLADVDGMAYTVKTSTSYAPSYQIDIVNDVTKITYARLVWEPYMQTTSPGDKTGTYTNLEDGLWWGNDVWQDGKKVSPSLFVGGGSQSDPRPLTFFQKIFGDDAQVDFFGLKQGSTTESTSTVTSLTFEGNNVPLDSVDATPYDSKDVAAAVDEAKAPLTAEIASLKASLVTDIAGAVDKAKAPLTAEIASLKASLVTDIAGAVDKAKAPLTAEIASLKAALATAQNAATATANERAIAKANDAAAAKANIVSITGTKKVGKTVTAKTESITGASHSYQWSVAGKSVKGADNATFKLPRSGAKHSLLVKITTSWKDANNVAHSVTATATNTRAAYIAR